MPANKTTLIIPALNEEGTIAGVVRNAKKYVDEIIVVNDGSTDQTAEQAEGAGAVVLTHEHNQGYDRSVDDGFNLAALRGAKIFITFDADGQHNPEDLPRFIEPIKQGHFDLVVGQRQRKQRLVEHLFGWYSWLRTRHNDPLCGLKSYSRPVYDLVGCFDRIQSIGTQLFFAAAHKGFRIKRIPITIRERKDHPRFEVRLRGNWKIFKALLKVAALV